MDRIVSFLVRYRKANALATVGAVLLFSLFAARIGFENSVESFFAPEDPDRLYYNAFKKEFGDDQVILLAIPMGDVFTRDSLARIDTVSKALRRLPSVRKVRSLTEVQDIVGTSGGFEVRPFIRKIPDDPRQLDRLRASALANALYRIDLVSMDGKTACLAIEAKYSQREDRYKQLVGEIQAALETTPLKGCEYYMAGDPLIELRMTHDMWGDLFRITPLTFLCIGILLWLIFRSWLPVATQMVVVGLCSAWLLGFMGLLRWPVNAVTVGLPALVLVIAVLNCIHIVGLYRIELEMSGDRLQATRQAIRRSMFPCFMANLTTAMGFASNAVTSLIPVAQFAWAGAFATMSSYVIFFMTMPWFVSLLPAHTVRPTRGEQRAMGSVLGWVRRAHEHPVILVAGFGLVIVASVIGLSRIRVETNELNFLRETNPVKKAVDYIEQHVGGATPLEIMVETSAEGGIREPRVLRQIEKLEAFMQTLPKFVKSVSPVAFIKQMNRAFNEENPAFYSIPDSREIVAQYLLTYTLSGRHNDLNDFVDYDYGVARIRARTAMRGSAELAGMFRQIQEFARTNLDRDIRVRVTSHSLLVTNMVGSLVQGQLAGMAVLTVMMFVVFAVAFRSVVIGLVALIPNIMPLLIELGLMGWIDATLNVGTAITVSITFGLVVDDTIHLLHHIQHVSREEKNVREVLRKVLDIVGSPVIITAGLLAFGFALMATGTSLLTVYFGLLCAFTISVALLCDLFLTPFMAIHIGPFRRALMEAEAGHHGNDKDLWSADPAQETAGSVVCAPTCPPLSGRP